MNHEIKNYDSNCMLLSFPNEVENNSKNLAECLGGIEILDNSLNQDIDSKIMYKIDSEDPCCKFIFSNQNMCCELVFEISADKITEAAEWKLIGIAEKFHSFDSLFDFYMAPEDIYRYPIDILMYIDNPKIEVPSRLKQKDVIMPPIFIRQTKPFNYNFNDNLYKTSNDKNSNEYKADLNDIFSTFQGRNVKNNHTNSLKLLERGVNGPVNLSIKFEGSTVPEKPSITVEIDQQLFDRICEMLESRPIWLKVALINNIGFNVNQTALKKVLSQTCYMFIDGPWRSALVKLGYDPRKDPAARIYQTIDFRDPFFRSLAQKNQKYEKENNNHIDYQMNFPPSKLSVLYQLCDINDDKVRNLCNQSKIMDSCHKQYGWFDKSTLEYMRDALILRVKILREKNCEGNPYSLEPE